MEELDLGSLLNGKYEKVLDIIGRTVKNRNDVNKNKKDIIKIIPELGVSDLDNLMSGFNFIWYNLPKEIFDIKNIDDFNLRLNQFARYVVSIEDQFKDHGFSLLVAYYLKICKEFLINCI